MPDHHRDNHHDDGSAELRTSTAKPQEQHA
jgi:hypothetical protein